MKIQELYKKVCKDFDKALKNKEAIEKIKSGVCTTEEKAVLLHDAFCDRNHTDGCGWHYETTGGVHNWGYPSHKRWLAEAKQL